MGDTIEQSCTHYLTKRKELQKKKITNGKTLKHLLVIFSTLMILDFPTKLKHHFLNNNVIHF